MSEPWKAVKGAVVAPKGFSAGVASASLKSNRRASDVMVIVSDRDASAAGVYTTNEVVAPAVVVSRERTERGRARAVVANAGNANTCTGRKGLSDARRMCAVAERALGIPRGSALVASTGIIGKPLPMSRVERAIRKAAADAASNPRKGLDAARAIMTTDTRPKHLALELAIDGKPVRIGGIAKGSGMVAPNMATMHAFLTTDAEVEPAYLRRLVRGACDESFNIITIDGHTSTSDTVAVLAGGASGVTIRPRTKAARLFRDALDHLCLTLALEIVGDGEGATRAIEINVRRARTRREAQLAARAIASSPLVKAAAYGADPNWGRIISAAGYSGARFDPERSTLSMGGEVVYRKGKPIKPSKKVRAAIRAPYVVVDLDLAAGPASARVYTCDLTEEYVRINAHYHT